MHRLIWMCDPRMCAVSFCLLQSLGHTRNRPRRRRRALDITTHEESCMQSQPGTTQPTAIVDALLWWYRD